MKAILMSIRPEWVAKILNGEKTLEIRKRFPKDYVGWVYIYCTKKTFLFQRKDGTWVSKGDHFYEGCNPIHFEGKVIARFWCDKVEEIIYGITHDTKNCPKKDQEFDLQTETLNDKELKEQSCLSYNELHNYFEKEFNTSDNYFKTVFGYAIHVAKLEIFDKPKELKEFKAYIGAREISVKKYSTKEIIIAYGKPLKSLTSAPQSWCYVEV